MYSMYLSFFLLVRSSFFLFTWYNTYTRTISALGPFLPPSRLPFTPFHVRLLGSDSVLLSAIPLTWWPIGMGISIDSCLFRKKTPQTTSQPTAFRFLWIYRNHSAPPHNLQRQVQVSGYYNQETTRYPSCSATSRLISGPPSSHRASFTVGLGVNPCLEHQPRHRIPGLGVAAA